jgi:acyl carrier protein
MDHERTGDRIRAYIVKQFAPARGRSFGDDDHLLEHGIIDSLGVLDLVAHLEQEFGISIGDDDLSPENFQSVSRLAAFVTAKQNGGGR